jgi:hypothetical protein
MGQFREFVARKEAEAKKVSHPKYDHWASVIGAHRAEGREPFVVIYRPEDILGYKPAKIYLKVHQAGSAVFSDGDDWDADLDRALIDLRVKAIDKANEAQRYNLLIEHELEKIEARYGDGFFNSVFVQYVRDVGPDSPDFQNILQYSTALWPNKDSRTYSECYASVESVIANKARELKHVLGYGLDEVTDILTGAIVQNLDERFSVTNRRKMGLL